MVTVSPLFKVPLIFSLFVVGVDLNLGLAVALTFLIRFEKIL